MRTVALCGADDAIFRPIAERQRIEGVVDDLSPLAKGFGYGQALLRHQKTRALLATKGREEPLLEKSCVVPASEGVHGRQAKRSTEASVSMGAISSL